MPRTAVIVGAGIGGLAAGIALGRAGWNVRIVERATSPRELGFALALAPNAMAALRELGVADAVERKGAEVDVFDVRRGDGALLKRIDFRGGTARSVVTLRPALHGTLLDAVGPEALLLGREVEGFANAPAGATINLAGGTSLDADIVIGADGVGSAIRRRLHPGEPPPRPSGYHALRGVTHDVPHRPGDVSTTIYLGDGIEAGVARASATSFYWYMSLADEFVPSTTASAAQILEKCTRGMDERFVSIARAARLDNLRLERLWIRDPISEWGNGPVTLLGDAAHPVLPHTAQGAALALEDAVALGLALAPGGDPIAALRRYEAVRSRRTRRVIRAGPRIAAMTTTRSRTRILARNAAIRLLPGGVLSVTLRLHARDPHRLLRGRFRTPALGPRPNHPDGSRSS
jgi:2-polyprenyl-6-methoxyphenol hydroxylase-like FAD-dependent oxidoreductase